MSSEASEIVTSLTTVLRQHLVDLHNQNMNDVQGIIGQTELRVLERFAALETRIAELERRIPKLLEPVP